MKYPEKIQEIVKEAPMAYGIVLLDDYRNGRITVAQAVKDWKNQKDKFNSNTHTVT